MYAEDNLDSHSNNRHPNEMKNSDISRESKGPTAGYLLEKKE